MRKDQLGQDVIEWQAEAFIGYHDKMRGDWGTDFRRWADSKDFQPKDEARIRREIVRIMSRDIADFNDWFRVPPKPVEEDNEDAA